MAASKRPKDIQDKLVVGVANLYDEMAVRHHDIRKAHAEIKASTEALEVLKKERPRRLIELNAAIEETEEKIRLKQGEIVVIKASIQEQKDLLSDPLHSPSVVMAEIVRLRDIKSGYRREMEELQQELQLRQGAKAQYEAAYVQAQDRVRNANVDLNAAINGKKGAGTNKNGKKVLLDEAKSTFDEASAELDEIKEQIPSFLQGEEYEDKIDNLFQEAKDAIDALRDNLYKGREDKTEEEVKAEEVAKALEAEAEGAGPEGEAEKKEEKKDEPEAAEPKKAAAPYHWEERFERLHQNQSLAEAAKQEIDDKLEEELKGLGWSDWSVAAQKREEAERNKYKVDEAKKILDSGVTGADLADSKAKLDSDPGVDELARYLIKKGQDKRPPFDPLIPDRKALPEGVPDIETKHELGDQIQEVINKFENLKNQAREAHEAAKDKLIKAKQEDEKAQLAKLDEELNQYILSLENLEKELIDKLEMQAKALRDDRMLVNAEDSISSIIFHEGTNRTIFFLGEDVQVGGGKDLLEPNKTYYVENPENIFLTTRIFTGKEYKEKKTDEHSITPFRTNYQNPYSMQAVIAGFVQKNRHKDTIPLTRCPASKEAFEAAFKAAKLHGKKLDITAVQNKLRLAYGFSVYGKNPEGMRAYKAKVAEINAHNERIDAEKLKKIAAFAPTKGFKKLEEMRKELGGAKVKVKEAEVKVKGAKAKWDDAEKVYAEAKADFDRNHSSKPDSAEKGLARKGLDDKERLKREAEEEFRRAESELLTARRQEIEASERVQKAEADRKGKAAEGTRATTEGTTAEGDANSDHNEMKSHAPTSTTGDQKDADISEEPLPAEQDPAKVEPPPEGNQYSPEGQPHPDILDLSNLDQPAPHSDTQPGAGLPLPQQQDPSPESKRSSGPPERSQPGRPEDQLDRTLRGMDISPDSITTPGAPPKVPAGSQAQQQQQAIREKTPDLKKSVSSLSPEEQQLEWNFLKRFFDQKPEILEQHKMQNHKSYTDYCGRFTQLGAAIWNREGRAVPAPSGNGQHPQSRGKVYPPPPGVMNGDRATLNAGRNAGGATPQKDTFADLVDLKKEREPGSNQGGGSVRP